MIPPLPRHIAIITGAGSAALSDMQRLIENRWPGLRRTVIGVLVQGPRATEEIVRGLAAARRLSNPSVAKKRGEPPVDLVIVGRGGGSPEDLWAFNLEPVVRAIIASPVPVVSAVGHESDILVSDLVADLRASTPSDAIERVVPVLPELYYLLDEFEERLSVASRRQIHDSKQLLSILHARLRVAPMAGLNRAKAKVLALSSRIQISAHQSDSVQRSTLLRQQRKAKRIHPHEKEQNVDRDGIDASVYGELQRDGRYSERCVRKCAQIIHKIRRLSPASEHEQHGSKVVSTRAL